VGAGSSAQETIGRKNSGSAALATKFTGALTVAPFHGELLIRAARPAPISEHLGGSDPAESARHLNPAKFAGGAL